MRDLSAADPLGDFDPDSPQQALGRVLAAAGGHHAHVFGWWSTHEAFTQQTGSQEVNFGLRTYLGLSHQKLQLIAPGQMDSPASYPLAYWHDYAAGAAPRRFQVYEPFGTGAAPTFLRR